MHEINEIRTKIKKHKERKKERNNDIKELNTYEQILINIIL